MGFNPTNEQKNALDATGRVLVSAAAGSGKTAVLVERVVNMLTDEIAPVDADRLLIVTFTNAAAAEMRSRLNMRISEELRKNPKSELLKRQKFLLGRASICTIDSFCISLCREYFYLLDIAPDFRIADNSVVKKIESTVLQGILANEFSEKNADFLALCDALGSENADSALADAIRTIYTYLRSVPYPDEYIADTNRLYAEFDADSSPWSRSVISNAKTQVSDAYSALKNAYDELADSELYDAYGERFEQDLKWLRTASDAILTGDWDTENRAVIKNPDCPTGRRPNGSDPDFAADMQNARLSAEKVIANIKRLFIQSSVELKEDFSRLTPLVARLMKLVTEFSSGCEKMKRSAGMLDFADIEFAVLHLLCSRNGQVSTPTEIAHLLSDRYSEVLVDEYQDTNDLQNTIFELLSDNGSKLFMVGDVKQSIYRFRQANPGNFLRFRSELPPYESGMTRSKVIMPGNFRSAPQVCEYINRAFSMMMSERAGQMDYGDEDKLIPLGSFVDIPHRVQLHVAIGENQYAAEAQHIAEFIADNVGKLTVSNGGAPRAAEYRDFCVLLRARKHIGDFSDAMKAAGIPVWSDTDDKFIDSPQVSAIISMLTAIDNPAKDISLISAMCSGLYGFTADECAKIRLVSRKSVFYAALVKYAENDEHAAYFLSELERYRRLAVSVGASEMIRRIYDDTGFLNAAAAADNGAQERLNLITLVEFARSYEDGKNGGLAAFLRYADHAKRSGTAPAQIPVITERDNVVRIMTIHRSKGLQFPVCIVASLGSEINSDEGRAVIQLSERMGIGLRVLDKAKGARLSTLSFDAIKLENARLSMSEELRVLYVAMTRAQDMLIMSAGGKTDSMTSEIRAGIDGDRFLPSYVLGASSIFKLISPVTATYGNGFSKYSADGAGYPDSDVVMVYSAAEEKTASEEKPIEAAAPDNAVIALLEERLGYVYPFEAVNEIEAKQSASRIAHEAIDERYDFSDVPMFIEHKSVSAAGRGTNVHKFMQLCDFSGAEKSISGELERLCTAGLLNREEMSSLDEGILAGFFESELFRRVMKSGMYEREKKFIAELDACDADSSLPDIFRGEQVVIQGVSDLVLYEPDGIVIIDYKTDWVQDMQTLVSRYSVQLDIYAKCLTLVTGQPVKEKIIYSFRLKQSASV